MGKNATAVTAFLLCIYGIAAIVCPGNAQEHIGVDARFARKLYAAGEYRSAALEYERLLFYSDSNGDTTQWRYMLGMCYLHTGHCRRAIGHFLSLDTTHEIFENARYQAAWCNISLNQPGKAAALLENARQDSAVLLRGYAYLVQDGYEKANTDFASVGTASAYAAEAASLQRITDSLMHFQPKKYFYAGMLSVIPGLGHTYTGRWKDGFFSFSVIGVFGGVAAYYGYHDAYARAATVGTIASLFYAGSIYGALNGVRLYNQDRKKGLIDRAHGIFRGF